MRELDTRGIPYDRRELAYALNRPPHLKQPWPVPGQRVRYRRRDWSTDTVMATILTVQARDDTTDPWLWHLVRDPWGQILLDDGRPRHVMVADPWPWVHLRPDDNLAEIVETREGRLRGSAGWLPLTWHPNPDVVLPDDLVPQALQPIGVNTSLDGLVIP